jgi:hypothetical protein
MGVFTRRKFAIAAKDVIRDIICATPVCATFPFCAPQLPVAKLYLQRTRRKVHTCSNIGNVEGSALEATGDSLVIHQFSDVCPQKLPTFGQLVYC